MKLRELGSFSILETMRVCIVFLVPFLVLGTLFAWWIPGADGVRSDLVLETGDGSMGVSFAAQGPRNLSIPYFPVHLSLPPPSFVYYSPFDGDGTAEVLARDAEAKARHSEWFELKQANFQFAPLAHRKTVSPTGYAQVLPYIQKFGVMSLSKPFLSNEQFVVLLDAGHGGSDPGTIGTDGLLEKELSLDISNRVKTLLLAHPNISVALSRKEDVGYSREQRVSAAKSSQADLLISLHFNNLPQKSVTLVESFYAGLENILESESGTYPNGLPRATRVARTSTSDLGFTEDSKRIAEILQRNIYSEVKAHNSNAVNAGIKNDTLYMLTQSYIPGTLIELTCLSNPEEELRLQSDEYRDDIAAAIANGIIEYFAAKPAVFAGI